MSTSNTGNHRPKSQPSRKPAYLPFVLKTKDANGKWKVHAYINLKADLTSGVATLVLPDGTKVEKVNVFPNEKKEKSPSAGAQDAS